METDDYGPNDHLVNMTKSRPSTPKGTEDLERSANLRRKTERTLREIPNLVGHNYQQDQNCDAY